MWMNESEIDHALEVHAGHPVLSKLTRFLSDFRDIINSNTDGWAQWKPGGTAAEALMDLIRDADPRIGREAVMPKDTYIKNALHPIYRLCDQRKWVRPSYGRTAPQTVDITPEAFKASNPNAPLHIAKANKAADDMEKALNGKAHFASELIDFISRGRIVGRTQKEKNESLAKVFFQACDTRGMDKEEQGEIMEQCLGWAEQWHSLSELHNAASQALVESVSGR